MSDTTRSDDEAAIFSLRIVSIDSYMKVPLLELDTCYSEFRANEVKQVPVIRVFGTDSNGNKTCAHVHGTFPYLYIPYAGNGTEADADRFGYQLATSLDKAINISLGQANSSAQHIYKIVVVKGMPFYGYHRKEHKYMKVFLYNPAFIRRAANLLQNGAILGRIFQPHESHVPFILQFMIDFNLYGMSFMHVPAKKIKFRQSLNIANDGFGDVSNDPRQTNYERMSTCKQEIDVNSVYILNRFQVAIKDEDSEHANPGIAFIWSDERGRRQKIGGDVEPLVISHENSQIRSQAIPAESEIFHRAALDKRLEQIRTSSPTSQSDPHNTLDQTLTEQTLNTNRTNRKFNLNQFLSNSVYPAECDVDDLDETNGHNMWNASHLIDHVGVTRSGSAFNKSISQRSNDNVYDPNDTIVDEDLVLSLTKVRSSDQTLLNESLLLDDEEHNVLDILENLEDCELSQNDQTFIDIDSVLAPLTQSNNVNQIATALSQRKAHTKPNNSFGDNDSDDEIFNEFSMSMMECLGKEVEESTNLSDSLKIPQLDGSTDSPPKRNFMRKSTTRRTAHKSPLRNTRKYPKLDITVNKSPNVPSNRPTRKMPVSKLVFEECDRNNKSAKLEPQSHKEKEPIFSPVPTKYKLRTVSIRIERDEALEQKLLDAMRQDQVDTMEDDTKEPEFIEPERRYPKRNRTKRFNISPANSASQSNKENDAAEKDEEKMDFLYSWYKWSNCRLAHNYDEERSFFPQPGPSTINYYEEEDIKGYHRPINSKTRPSNRPLQTKETASTSGIQEKVTRKRSEPSSSSSKRPKTDKKKIEAPPAEENSDWEDDVHIQSFYEKTFCELSNMHLDANNENIRSPTPQNNKSSRQISTRNATMKRKRSREMNGVYDPDMIQPEKRAPTGTVINDSFGRNEFPKEVHPKPFYSNRKDVLANNGRKEVGHNVLQLTSNSIADLDAYSGLTAHENMAAWQTNLATRKSLRSKNHKNNAELKGNPRKALTTNHRVTIAPSLRPPLTPNVQNWVSTRNSVRTRHKSPDDVIVIDESPAKVRRERPTCVRRESEDETALQTSILKKSMNNPVLSNILANKSITVSVRTKSGSKNVVISKPDNFVCNDDSDDDVICIDDADDFHSKQLQDPQTYTASGKQIHKHLERPSFLSHLNLEDTIEKWHSLNTSFGIRGAAAENSFGFRMELDNFQCAKSNIEHNYLTILSLETHCQTRTNLLPDPAHDELTFICYAIHNDVPFDKSDLHLPRERSGIIINMSQQPTFQPTRMGIDTAHMKLVNTEAELIMALVELVRKWDPDIFAGYEIELASWGYIFQRCQVMNIDIVPLLSRIPTQKIAKFQKNEDDAMANEEQGVEYESEYKLYGRILLDVWRLLRGEIALTSYTFENCMYHIMHRRYPLYTHEKLTRLYTRNIDRHIVIEYYKDRAKGTLEIMNQLDLIGRTCELAKLFGIQFYEVLSRGSQFRVESMMLRIAKPKNLVPVSPSVQQRAHMRSPEYLPLIIEPYSRFYSDPVIVLDFQSLYPSMIIAYNYCFSTSLGRVEHLGQSVPFEFGASQLRVPRNLLEKLIARNLIHISPCGAVFVKSSVREGVLPRMLREILDARLMVKQSMKLHKTDKLLQRVLHSRQLGLKLMANVTYGYTAANFSGRMPCVEVGDSVVSKGRETLERAIKTVELNKKWGCRVVYGDTDSLFVMVPGRSRAEAFRIGSEIAETVTNENPFPVRLKLEKVYQPCILQTKKRYVGYMYESADQKEPVYEAKGIETVRRDGCPAVAKMLEKTLHILFETCDVSAVKQYICRQFTKILSGRANVQDLVFAKEFRGVRGYKPGACVPSLELTRAAMQIDRRAEPRRGERVPYLIINGPPGVPLIRLVRSPHEYLTNEALKINAMYYITKVLIPPMNRCLLLIGADANQWFTDLPRKAQYLLSLDIASNVINANNVGTHDMSMNESVIRGVAGVTYASAATKKSTISQYFSSTNCICDCGGHTQHGICSKCLEPKRRQQSTLILSDKCIRMERKYRLCQDICSACCGNVVDNKCISLECPVLFMLNRWKRDSKQIQFYRQILDKHFTN